MTVIENLGERKYSFWQALGLSFFSKDLYDDVGRNWKGTAYGTLFLTMILISVPRAANYQREVSADLPGFVKQIPDFQIEKGVFSSSVTQPYQYQVQNSEIVIDTTGKINSLDQVPNIAKLDNVILVNKTKHMDRRKRLGISMDRTYDFSRYPSFFVNQEKLTHWSDVIIRWTGVIFFLFIALFGFLFEAVVVLIYGLIGTAVSEMLDKSLDFKVALRLAVVSHIPALLATTLLIFFGIRGAWVLILGFLFTLPYLYFAVSSQKIKKARSSPERV